MSYSAQILESLFFGKVPSSQGSPFFKKAAEKKKGGMYLFTKKQADEPEDSDGETPEKQQKELQSKRDDRALYDSPFHGWKTGAKEGPEETPMSKEKPKEKSAELSKKASPREVAAYLNTRGISSDELDKRLKDAHSRATSFGYEISYDHDAKHYVVKPQKREKPQQSSSDSKGNNGWGNDEPLVSFHRDPTTRKWIKRVKGSSKDSSTTEEPKEKKDTPKSFAGAPSLGRWYRDVLMGDKRGIVEDVGVSISTSSSTQSPTQTQTTQSQQSTRKDSEPKDTTKEIANAQKPSKSVYGKPMPGESYIGGLLAQLVFPLNEKRNAAGRERKLKALRQSGGLNPLELAKLEVNYKNRDRRADRAEQGRIDNSFARDNLRFGKFSDTGSDSLYEPKWGQHKKIKKDVEYIQNTNGLSQAQVRRYYRKSNRQPKILRTLAFSSVR